MKTVLKHLSVAALLAMGSLGTAHATMVSVIDNSWYSFDIDDFTAQSFGTEWIDGQIDTTRGYVGDGSALSLTFTLATPTYLKVVDAGFAGDRFEVFDNGVSLGQTSVPTDTFGINFATGDFDAAYADGRYSTGFYLLGAGSHTITGALSSTTVPFNATVGAIALQPIPVPAAIWFLGSGLAALFGFARRSSHA